MRLLPSWLLASLVLLVGAGCPLDIQVREEPETDAGCFRPSCVRDCSSDRDCPDDERCNGFDAKCEPGARLTQECGDNLDCTTFARCLRGRCTQTCNGTCPKDYQCSPENTCVESCAGLPPPKSLGRYCDSSQECGRCGFCADVESQGAKRCHQPCRSDAECPGATAGACVAIPGSALRACRQP
jgi:hypothetical protein